MVKGKLEKKTEKKVRSNSRLAANPLASLRMTEEEVPSAIEKKEEPSRQKNVPDGWERSTYLMRVDQVNFIRNMAWMDSKKVKDVIEEAVTDYWKKHHVRLEVAAKRVMAGEEPHRQPPPHPDAFS